MPPLRSAARLAALALLLAAAPALVPRHAAAQGRPLRATGLRGIAFGNVLPGVPQLVLATDPTRSAQFDLTGPNRIQVEITFTLPGALAAPGGGSIPIVFEPTSAGWSSSQTTADIVPFDPMQPFAATLSGNGRGTVFLGARLQPPAGVPSGAYAAPVTITLALTGL